MNWQQVADLRTPLTTLNGRVWLAQKHLAEGKIETAVKDLMEASEAGGKMKVLVNELVEAAEQGKEVGDDIVV